MGALYYLNMRSEEYHQGLKVIHTVPDCIQGTGPVESLYKRFNTQTDYQDKLEQLHTIPQNNPYIKGAPFQLPSSWTFKSINGVIGSKVFTKYDTLPQGRSKCDPLMYLDRKYEKFVEGLATRGYREEDIRKVMGQNFLRVYREGLPE